MSIIKTEAIVIKGFRYGESSKISTFYTKELGKMTGIIKATRSIKSKFGSALENINHTNIIFNRKENRELQFITGAECINSFKGIKSDFDKISTAYRIIEILNHSVHNFDTNKEIFILVKETLENLDKAEKNFYNYLLYFQVKLTVLLGISPGFSEITDKSTESDETLINKTAFKLNRRQFSVLSSIERNNPEFITNLSIENAELLRMIDIYDLYMSSHLENFGFLKTKKINYDINC